MKLRPDLETVVARAKGEILADMMHGRVPPDVYDFAELHNYTDANMYGTQGRHFTTRELEAVQDELSEWIETQQAARTWVELKVAQ